MAEDIPPDFDRAWSKSDVVLHALNSEGKELHANKAVLSVFSTYFDALFSGRFAEKDMNSVDIDCSYNAMKEILCNIHQIGLIHKKEYDPQMLGELYTVGDYYNFPHIRRLCLYQMTDRPSIGMAMTAATLDLREILMDILMNLENVKVRRFLGNENVHYLFTKKEVLRLFKKIVGKHLTKGIPYSNFSTMPLNLEEITEEIQNPRMDLTKPWESADVAIVTLNSLGRLLFSSKSVMNTKSIKFKDLQLAPIVLEDGLEISSITVDAEYTTMKEILSVIHNCDPNDKEVDRVLHPALLHSMYRAASVDQLNIRMIRDWCRAQLLKRPNVDSWEVLCDLNISEYVELLYSEWRDWVYREDGSLSYRKGEEVVVVTPYQDKPHFGAALTLWLINSLSPYVR